ncbi:MAG: bifunctional protein-serine/threonine kinase/phosphatase [Pseudomonadota bacterium]
MMTQSAMEVRVGFLTEAGRRPSNDDFILAAMGENSLLADVVVSIADGTGGSPEGRMAAETAVRGFLDAYLHQPKTLSVERAAANALNCMNNWLYAQGRSGHHREGLVTTFTALILRAREAHIVHVGDTRIYRLRGERLARLTQDHTHPHPDLHHVLVRAVGMEDQVRADYQRHSLEAHDRFLLCTDGVHAALNEGKICALMAMRGTPQEDAARIVESALAASGQDNATALVLDILALPSALHRDIESSLAELPIAELPQAGEITDGYRLLSAISNGRYSRLFHALDTKNSNREVALKFPHPRVAQDAIYRSAFTRESWVASQVQSPYLAEVIEPEPGRRTRLYVVMPFYRGETLECRLKRQPAVSLVEGVDIAIKLSKAIYALNRRRIIHRDIKPENILLELGAAGASGLRLIDLGVARLPDVNADGDVVPGTPSYMAPELILGQAGDEFSEVYALGVSLYRMWSGGEYPYGEIEPFSTPRYTKRVALARYRPDLPAWLDQVLARATAVDPAQRYADTMEFAFELENAALKGAQLRVRHSPLIERDPVRFWQVISAILLLMLILALAFHS